MDNELINSTPIMEGKTKSYTIEKASDKHIDEIEELYNALTDYLQQGVNYPGWTRGVYPTRETAEFAINKDCLFILKVGNEIAGTVILSHRPEKAYSQVDWTLDEDYKYIYVVYTLAVHPKYMKQGVGEKLMNFIKAYSKAQGMKAIRLDVVATNTPACALYEKNGFKYVQTIDLGLNIPDLKWFKCYELIL